MKKYLTFLAVVTCVLSFQMAAADELVLNGDFEIGNFTSWTQSGNLSFTGVGSGNAHSGTYAAYFGPVGSLGFISQNLTTVPGGTYDLTFWLKNAGLQEVRSTMGAWQSNGCVKNSTPNYRVQKDTSACSKMPQKFRLAQRG